MSRILKPAACRAGRPLGRLSQPCTTLAGHSSSHIQGSIRSRCRRGSANVHPRSRSTATSISSRRISRTYRLSIGRSEALMLTAVKSWPSPQANRPHVRLSGGKVPAVWRSSKRLRRPLSERVCYARLYGERSDAVELLQRHSSSVASRSKPHLPSESPSGHMSVEPALHLIIPYRRDAAVISGEDLRLDLLARMRARRHEPLEDAPRPS